MEWEDRFVSPHEGPKLICDMRSTGRVRRRTFMEESECRVEGPIEVLEEQGFAVESVDRDMLSAIVQSGRRTGQRIHDVQSPHESRVSELALGER